ncbi:hypothetical protein CL684_00205 [Candidatus Campbellbacteria bacterium]|nr:hypothetical protein [Candidatus Campbellbacteria bacterium]|tara:strand:- start:1019 stop:1792 length:774 start_codon:yes stop_codon:yes gene_type:complete
MNISILFENKNVLIIDKPVGLVIHGDGRNTEPSVVDWVVKNYPNIQGVGEDMVINHKGKEIVIPRPGIVHRIDRETSGILVITKTQESFLHLKEQFKERKVEKIYHAVCHGSIKNDSGEITEPIGRHPKDFRKKVAGNSARGKVRGAQTDYTVIARYEDVTAKKDIQGKYPAYTYVEVRPKTGRTHQIRVHLKWLNHPIVGDTLYEGKRSTAFITRTALHAYSITFKDIDGETINVNCPLPKDIQAVIDGLKKKSNA